MPMPASQFATLLVDEYDVAPEDAREVAAVYVRQLEADFLTGEGRP